MINNKDFLNWVDDGEIVPLAQRIINNDELIGLMTQWLLDKGYCLDKFLIGYYVSISIGVNEHKVISENTSFYDCLVSAINKLGEV
jgi:hypothetical protein